MTKAVVHPGFIPLGTATATALLPTKPLLPCFFFELLGLFYQLLEGERHLSMNFAVGSGAGGERGMCLQSYLSSSRKVPVHFLSLRVSPWTTRQYSLYKR